MSSVTYDYYRIFYYVGKYGSFTKAAQMLKNSQPNITRAMNNLEGQLGVTLFTRDKRGVKLTKDGEKLFTRISIACEQIQIAESEIENSRNGDKKNVYVGVSDIAMYEVLYPVLSEFRELHPDISLNISNESTFSAIESLNDGRIDFAIVTTPIPNVENYRSKEVMKISEHAVISKNYCGDIPKISDINDLSDYPLIMLTNGTATRLFYEDIFAGKGVELKPQMTASNINQILSMVKAGLGIGFIPETILDMDDSFVKLDLDVEIPPRRICIVSDRGKEISGTAGILVDYILRKYSKNNISK